MLFRVLSVRQAFAFGRSSSERQWLVYRKASEGKRWSAGVVEVCGESGRGMAISLRWNILSAWPKRAVSRWDSDVWIGLWLTGRGVDYFGFDDELDVFYGSR